MVWLTVCGTLRRHVEREKLEREKQLRMEMERQKSELEQRLLQYQDEIRLAQEALVSAARSPPSRLLYSNCFCVLCDLMRFLVGL